MALRGCETKLLTQRLTRGFTPRGCSTVTALFTFRYLEYFPGHYPGIGDVTRGGKKKKNRTAAQINLKVEQNFVKTSNEMLELYVKLTNCSVINCF